MKSLAFGEILWDIVEGEPHLGGAPFNVAAHLAKLGMESSIISSVGNDPLGKQALDRCHDLGVSSMFVQTTADFPTGTVDIFLKDGQPDYSITENVAWDNIRLNDEFFKAVEEDMWDVLVFGTLAQRTSQNRSVVDEIFHHGIFKNVFFDVNIRKHYYSEEVLFKSLERCSILKLNDEELDVISTTFFKSVLDLDEFVHQLARKFRIETIITTMGAKGASVFHKGHHELIPGVAAEVKDTIGAGDSFSAAFLYTYLSTGDAFLAAANGCKLGAFVASNHGAIPDYNPQELLNI